MAQITLEALGVETGKYLSHANGTVSLQNEVKGGGEIFTLEHISNGKVALACTSGETGKYLSHASGIVGLNEGYQGAGEEWIYHDKGGNHVAFECAGAEEGLFLSHASNVVGLEDGYQGQEQLWAKSKQRQPGFAAVAIAQGANNNAQAIFLGNDDALPYLIWQNSAGNWESDVSPLTTAQERGFNSLAMCKGYQGNLYVILLDKLSQQPYLLVQNSNGTWSDEGFIITDTDHLGGFSKVIMVSGPTGFLALLLGADDGQPYQIVQQENGILAFGSLPPTTSPYIFKTMAAAFDAVGNLQVVFLDTNGTPIPLWKNPSNEWTWWSNFPANTLVGGYKDLTMHLGCDKDLQVVMLGSNDGAPYLTWLDDTASKWHSDGPMTNVSNNSYFAITSCYGRSGGANYLSVLMIAESDGQIYQLYQDPLFGGWTSYSTPELSSAHKAGFRALAACVSGYDKSLLLPLIGSDNRMPYLMYENDPLAAPKWYWRGMLPLPNPFEATVTTTPPLTINGVLQQNGVTPPFTPGNVGICLSGGGSRAMCAGMGQLRGLATLLHADHTNLLSQVKAISTVSGGSWVGMSYAYLDNPAVSDLDFLGAYLKPSSLTPKIVNAPIHESLIGARCQESFSAMDLALQAFCLIALKGVSPTMVWQILIGRHILAYYGLYNAGAYGYPASSFTYNQANLDSILSNNNGLEGEIFNFVADQKSSSRIQRPFPICNMSMLVNYNGGQYAVPAQSTPFFTGVFSKPEGATDANGVQVGGGGVTSFAFNSYFKSLSGSTANVQQTRQWSLTDAVGVSSAAIAAGFWQLVRGFLDSGEDKLRQVLRACGKYATEEDSEFVEVNAAGEQVLTEAAVDMSYERILAMNLSDYEPIPQYSYWSPQYNNAISNFSPTQFADAGLLENTGIGGMLAYTDIDSLIAFVNSHTPLSETDHGIYLNGSELPNTNIKIDDQIPILFGYQPYDENNGYVTFAEAGSQGYNSVCQLFPSEDFAPLLQGLWAAYKNGDPATMLQSLTTVENKWFMIESGRNVQVLWNYLNPVSNWCDSLNQDVATICDDLKHFPNYSTFNTELSAQEVTLIANQTAWCVVEGGNQGLFTGLFKN